MASSFSKNTKYQPILRDLQSFKQLKEVFRQDHSGQRNLDKRSHRRRQPEFNIHENVLKPSSFLEDIEKACQPLSFETKLHNIYDPSFSSEKSLSESPKLKFSLSRVKSNAELPMYVYDQTKMNNSSQMNKRSFDTFGSAHSTNTKVETYMSLPKQFHMANDRNFGSQSESVLKKKTVAVKNFINLMDSVNFRQSQQNLSGQNNKSQLSSKNRMNSSYIKQSLLNSIDKFCQALENNDIEQVESQNNSMTKKIKNSIKNKSLVTDPCQFSKGQRKKLTSSIANQVQHSPQTMPINAVQLIEKLKNQSIYSQKSQGQVNTTVQQKRTLKLLLDKYQNKQSKSPLDKSPLSKNQQRNSSQLTSSVCLGNSFKWSQYHTQQEQCYLYGLPSNDGTRQSLESHYQNVLIKRKSSFERHK